MTSVSLRVKLNMIIGKVFFLPTMFVSVTGRCNSRCALCGIWKGPEDDLNARIIIESVASMRQLGLRNLVITGGEPLMRKDIFEVLEKLTGAGFYLILCTNGILLKRCREEVMKYFDGVVVSLDSHEASTYKSLRGIDAFDDVASGIESIVEGGMHVTIAHTLQKDNILNLAEFISFVRNLGVKSVSVRPIDAYSEGFGSEFGQLPARKALLPSEEALNHFNDVIEHVRRDFQAELVSGFITPGIGGLRKIRDYFLAKDEASFPSMRCDAPFSSCVIESNGDVRPCFFSGPFANLNQASCADMKRILNSDSACRARMGLNGRLGICRRCAYPYIWL